MLFASLKFLHLLSLLALFGASLAKNLLVANARVPALKIQRPHTTR